MSKLAWFHFYPGDWMKDPELRRCSPAARGIYVDLLCLMFECEERGVLSTGGEPWTDDEIAGAIPGDSSVVLSCLHELVGKRVLKRRANSGALYSNRLIRDEEQRQIKAKAGRKGGKRSARARRSKSEANHQAQPQAPSDSDSDSVNGSLGEIPEALRTEKVREALREWCAHRKAKKKPFSKQAARMCFRKWADEEWPAARVVAAIQHSIANDYQGIFEPSGPALGFRKNFTERKQDAVTAAIAAELARIPRKESA
jgi:hypothetical protein